jgi:hypothetical protein
MTWGPQWRSWLRHCAISQKVADSIPNGVNGIFRWHNPSGRNMVLELTQEYFLGGNGGRCVGLKILPVLCADCFKTWEPKPPGILTVCKWDCFTIYYMTCRSKWAVYNVVQRMLVCWDCVGSNPTAGVDVCCECCVLLGTCLCDELTTRPEKSYRLYHVVLCDLETSWMRRNWPIRGCRAKYKQTKISLNLLNYSLTNLVFYHENVQSSFILLLR